MIQETASNIGSSAADPVQDKDSTIVQQLHAPPPGLPRRLWQQAFPLGFRDEFFLMLALAWPSIVTTLLQFFLQTTSFIMCGHLSKEDLDGVALGNSLINVAGMSIGVGMSTACDTLFSQTYGSRNRKRIGLYLQRSFLLMNCSFVLLACLHLNVRPLLLVMHQVPEIAERASLYIRVFLPGLLFQFNFLVLSRYLQNQSRMIAPMVAAILGNLLNVVGQYVAIHVLGYGFLASAVLQAASLGLMFFLILGYILASGIYKETWDGWCLDCLLDWNEFVKLSIPGVFLIALEEWGFEIATIVAGTLGEVQLGAQSIIFQLESISYMIPFGMSVAVNIRVGQQLGAMQPVGAAQSYRVGLLMTVIIAVLTCNLFVLLRDQLPRLFTSDPEIVDAASRIIPLLGPFQLFDGISAVSCGAIRGTGRQVEGALLLFIGYYVIGLPIGLPLALCTGLEVTGTWIGLLAGIGAEALAFCCLVMRFDWAKEADLAQTRAYGGRSTWRRHSAARRRLAKSGECGQLHRQQQQQSDDSPPPLASETESEQAALLSSTTSPSGGGAAAGSYGAVDLAAAAATAAATTAAGLPHPEMDDIAFYSDPETFCELPAGLETMTDTGNVAKSTAAAATATAAATVGDAAAAAVANPRSRQSHRRSGRRRRLQRRLQQRALSGGGGNDNEPGVGLGLGLGLGGSSVLYTGRFYSSSRLLLDLLDDLDHDGARLNGALSCEEVQAGPRAISAGMLVKRIALLAGLAVCLAGSVALMLWTDSWLEVVDPRNVTASTYIFSGVTTVTTPAVWSV